ncbi:MAG: ribosome silencing factor [Chloroflexota bacterium]
MVAAAGEKQATDIVLLDTRGVCDFADYFIICSGESERQLQAISDEIAHTLKQAGVLPRHYEGMVDSGWLLLDFGDIIVHIFAPPQREYYRLEQLWNKAVPLVRVQ